MKEIRKMSERILYLAGSPNSGKTTLFNNLTGLRQKVANYPGVTVEKVSALISLDENTDVTVYDLPGFYSLNAQSIDEQIAVQELAKVRGNDLILAIVDATRLERHLGFILELRELNKPMVVVLNMIDIATRNKINIDTNALEEILGIPVIAITATMKSSVRQLLKSISLIDSHKLQNPPPFKKPDTVEERFLLVDSILDRCMRKPKSADQFSQSLDKVLLHPIYGSLAFIGILFLVFQSIFSLADTPMGLIESGVEFLGESTRGALEPLSPLLASLFADGIVAGVGSVLVFLPQILILFFFIHLMEASGYMARAAFLMDKLMALVGLQGRSFVPLLSSFACAIPGVMAARTIKDPNERLTTILIAPLMTCSARLPVYVLLVGAFIPNIFFFGWINLQTLAMFGLISFGVLAAILVALFMRRTLLQGKGSSFVMEMPSYKLPTLSSVLQNLYYRASLFIKKAGGFILIVSMALWALSTFPTPPEDYDRPAIHYSIAGRVGHFLEPVFKPIGFDWRIVTGLIPGFAAREVMVSALATVFAVEAADGDDEEALDRSLRETLQATWPPATGLALLAWYVFSPQCLATIVVARRETGGWRWPIFMFVYLLGLAYLAAWFTYQLFSSIGLG
jgi:ferrous iron transport protein B